MIPLSPIIRKNGFTYTQVCRGERSCIYAQNGTPELAYYEVFLIRHSRDKNINGKLIEARERFPKDEDFGITAWTYRNLKDAERRFEQIEGGGDIE